MKIKLIQKLLLALSAAAVINGTSARATDIPITNSGFEDPAYAANTYTDQTGAYPAWAANLAANTQFRIFGSGSQYVAPATAPYDGSQVGEFYFGNVSNQPCTLTYTGGGLGTFAANTTYTLTLQVGCTNFVSGNQHSSDTTINLTGSDGTTTNLLASSPAGSQFKNNWTTLTATFDTGTHPAVVGQAIGLYIKAINATGQGGDTIFDNARLTAVLNVAPPITVTAQPNTKGYDGTTAAAALPTITAGTLQDGDVATLTEAYDNSLIGTAKALIPSVVIRNAGGVDVTANYYVAKVNDNTGVILTDLTGSNLIHNWSFEANTNNLIYGDTGNTGNGITWSPPSSATWPIGYWTSSGNGDAFGLAALASGLPSPATGKQFAVESLFSAGQYQYLTYTGGNLGNFAADTTYTLKLAVNLVVGGDSGAEFNIYLLDLTTGPDGSVVVGTSKVQPTAAGWQDLTLTVNSGYVVGHQVGVKLSIYTPAIGSEGQVQGWVDNMRLTSEVILQTPYQLWATSISGFTDTDPTHDPDGDGMTNQQEFAFGLDPTKGSSNNPIVVPLDKTAGTFSYTRLDPLTASTGPTGLTYKIYTSPDLQTWTLDAGATQDASPLDYDVQIVQVTLSGLPLTAPKLFVRVAAE
jgi:hypothetical protein